jgi:predicted porin
MIGNGNGLNLTDNNDKKDTYVYLSAEKIFGGKGVFTEGMKFLGWTQNGVRSYDGNNDGIAENYDRDRWGLGFKFKKGAYRLTTEYMSGKGMIFQGPHIPSFGLGPSAGNPNAPGNGLNGKADGWYIDAGWHIPNTNWELDLRYDLFDRLKDDRFNIEYKTTTLGVQYFFNKKTRLTLNYAIRDHNAPNFPTGAGPNANLDGIKDRAAIQLTHIF